MSIPRVENLQSKIACAEPLSSVVFPPLRKNIYSFLGKDLTNRSFSDIMLQVSAETGVYSTQKYSSGRRGAPAKGVGRILPAREFKSLLLRQRKTRKNAEKLSVYACFFLFLLVSKIIKNSVF